MTFEEWNALSRHERNALIGRMVLGRKTRHDAEQAWYWCEMPQSKRGGNWTALPYFVSDDRAALSIQETVMKQRGGWNRYRHALLELHKEQPVKLFKWTLTLDANTRCYAAYVACQPKASEPNA